MPTSTFIDIGSDQITLMLGYVKDLLVDLTPLLLPIIGIGLGIIILYAIVNAIK
jgi:hypothetical protein